MLKRGVKNIVNGYCRELELHTGVLLVVPQGLIVSSVNINLNGLDTNRKLSSVFWSTFIINGPFYKYKTEFLVLDPFGLVLPKV